MIAPVPLDAAATRRARAASAARASPGLTVGVVLVLVLALAALLAPVLAPFPADAHDATHPLRALRAPGGEHVFGTDDLGRDVLSRVLYGARTSLLITVAVLGLALAAGVPVGLLAGFAGGWVDDLLMRVADAFLAFPALVLALAVTLLLGPSVEHAAIAVAIAWWPWYARLARAGAATVRGRGYVVAARGLGVSRRRIVLRHVAPNALAPTLVQASLDASGVILQVSALSFLGLGAQDPTPEWGLMVSQGQGLLATSWWFSAFPAAAIVVTALAFNLIGEGLRARLDPRRAR